MSVIERMEKLGSIKTSEGDKKHFEVVEYAEKWRSDIEFREKWERDWYRHLGTDEAGWPLRDGPEPAR